MYKVLQYLGHPTLQELQCIMYSLLWTSSVMSAAVFADVLGRKVYMTYPVIDTRLSF